MSPVALRDESPSEEWGFATEEDALDVMSQAIREHGTAFMQNGSLGQVPEDGDWITIAEGAALSERATGQAVARVHP